MDLIKRLKKNKKGFTLVELIVVLVILAILAAIAIPTFNGYITKAKDKAGAAESRTVLMAAETVVAEANEKDTATTTGTTGENVVTAAKIAELAGVNADTISNIVINADGELTDLTYDSGNGTYVLDTVDGKHVMQKSTTSSDNTDPENP